MIQIMMNEQITMHTKPTTKNNNNNNNLICYDEKFIHENLEMFDEKF